MTVHVKVGGHGGEISISVQGYERPEAKNVSDANWLTCRVAADFGSWTGEARAAFTTHDFVSFASQLRCVVDGTATIVEFETDEGGLELAIEMERTGTCRIRGVVRETSAPSVALSFTLESDQSYLQATLKGVDAVVSSFPVREVPGRG